MAIRVLLDHHVPESHIVFLTFIAYVVFFSLRTSSSLTYDLAPSSTPQALTTLSRAFPAVKVVTSTVDPTLELVVHSPLSPTTNSSRGREQRDKGPPQEREGDGKRGVCEGEVVKEKAEWVIRPGFGDIAGRYYSI